MPLTKAPAGRKTNRKMPPRECPLTERKDIAKEWANRSGDALILYADPFEGRVYFHLRRFYTHEGKFLPTKKGVVVPVHLLREMATAFGKAHDLAVELGLLKEGGE
jgi:hypothetical protein